ncbi:RNA polymerase sigma factor [Pedobacter sp. AW31-3R]|uniref:RNA polymerase sigma factor n=1 Tax=Pedobacter sp. AW31-3R TaxID=3445781 RepID=UPI003F9FA0EB
MLCQTIIQNFKQGDPEAFERIYALFYKQIFSYCYRYTLSRESAEELTHDIFLRLWNTRDFVDPETGIKGYLITLSKNIVFTWLRNAGRSKKMRAEIQSYFTNEQSEFLPEKQMEATHDLNVMRNHLNCLPPKRKLVFEMIRFREMTYNEVADQLSISRDAVKDHMVKANKVIESMKKNKTYLDYVSIFYLLIYPYIHTL